MTRDELEFRISEYVDGTLGDADRATLERRLTRDAEARRLLAEYQRVEAILRAAPPVPAVDYDQLAARIADAVATDAASVKAGEPSVLFSFKWARRAVGVAAAACVLVAGSTWIIQGHQNKRVAVVEVVGPEVSQAHPVADIQVGPSPAIAARAPLGVQEAIVARPQRLLVASAGGGTAGTDELPY